MKRVIKFRVWDGKKMRDETGLYGATLNKGLAMIVEQGDILMQFTGLTDKNGKEIYEGDVVSYISERFGKEYKHKPYKVEWTEIIGEQGIYGYGFAMDDAKNYEVIGNIYENPELIKKGV